MAEEKKVLAFFPRDLKWVIPWVLLSFLFAGHSVHNTCMCFFCQCQLDKSVHEAFNELAVDITISLGIKTASHMVIAKRYFLH